MGDRMKDLCDALEEAIGIIESVEKDTNFTVDPWLMPGETSTVERLNRVLEAGRATRPTLDESKETGA